MLAGQDAKVHYLPVMHSSRRRGLTVPAECQIAGYTSDERNDVVISGPSLLSLEESLSCACMVLKTRQASLLCITEQTRV